MYEGRPGAVPVSLEGTGTSRLAKGWLAALAGAIAIALTFASLIGLGTGAAAAATPGISTSVTINGEEYNGTPVVDEGQEIIMKIQYSSAVAPGSTVKIALGPNVTLQDLPKGNKAIKEIKVDPADPNAILITFEDPLPADVNQGVLDLSFTVNSVLKSSGEKLTWNVDGKEQSLDLIIKKKDDTFANVKTSVSKSVPGYSTALNKNVSVTNGIVTVASGIIGELIPYTLQINSATAQNAFVITDLLPEGMTYLAGSFEGSQTTWDANGLNQITNTKLAFAPTITGNSFTGQLNLPGQSLTTLTYKASIADEATRLKLQAALQGAYDQIDQGKGGDFKAGLTNTANMGGIEKAGTIEVGGSVAGRSPNVTNAFKKSTSWTGGQAIEPAADGTLVPAKDVNFTFKTDLTQWKGDDAFNTLNSNVVISDKLPQQLSWKSAAPGFITSDVAPIRLADPLPATPAAFATDLYVDSYYVDEATQTLYVNLGKDNTRINTVTALAQLNTVNGLTVKDSTTVPGQKDYSGSNRAVWNYTDSAPRTPGSSSEINVTVQTKDDAGFNHKDFFNKEATTPIVEVDPGDSAEVAYKLTVGQGKGIDLTKSSIVDDVDTNIFDVSDPTKIKATGIYAGGNAMDASSFDLAIKADGRLVVTLSDAGKAQVTGWGIDKQFVLTLTLPTKPVDGKQTLKIKNKATLFGEDDKALYWSEASSEATTYGDEAEVRKTVRDTPNTEWTQNLRAEVDADGKLIQKNFVYNIALIPHGNFDGVKVIDVVDNLPSGLKFEGFVTDSNVDTGLNPSMAVQDLKGNIQARFDAAPGSTQGGKVTLFQKPGTVLDASRGVPSANLLVSIVDFAIDQAIVNTIGQSSATITPSNGYPLAIAKVDAEDGSKVIDDPHARFQILDAGDTVVVDNVFVQNGALRITGKDGTVQNVKVPTVGSYKVKEITAPAGYELSTATVPVTVAADGSSVAVTFPNRALRSYAVGDYVWVDADKNGMQDDSEVLEGVKVTLLDGSGNFVAETWTDKNGRYLFDELPAGDYQIKFELTPAQAAIYDFTKPNAGVDAQDSDADPATGLTVKFTLDGTNKALKDKTTYTIQDVKATGGIDPSWDAGVVLKPVPQTTPAGDGSALSNTGFGSLPLMALALLLSLAGGAAVVLTVRRKRDTAHH